MTTEFWNGYPHPGWLTLFGHTLTRTIRQAYRWFRGDARSEAHPAAQGKWGAAAGEAYLLFASPIEFDEFTEDHSPEQVQVFGSADVAVVLADTRWHRTILKTRTPLRNRRRAGFMVDDDLQRLVDLLRADERLVCLALSRPLIGHLPHRGLTQRKVEYGPEDFPNQYTELWRALSERRRAGLPTLVISGDVHHHAIRTADDSGLLEIVSSPLAMLEALDETSNLNRLRSSWKRVRGGLKSIWRGLKEGLRRGEERLRPSLDPDGDPASYPAFGDDGTWRAAAGTVVYEANADEFLDREPGGRPIPVEPSGLSAIEIRSTDGGHTVTVSSVLGFTDRQGQTTTRREDHIFRWDRLDAETSGRLPAWRKQ